MIETIGEDIWKVVGAEPGPTIVVFGGVHGNELTGIEVVRKMHSIFVGDGRDRPDHSMQLNRGTLYLILGNPKAIARNTRGSEDHADLNRCFKRDLRNSEPSLLSKEGVGGRSYEHERVKELAKILVDADISIDLHATNKPSVPFLCCVADDKHEKIYRWFDCDRVLADPKFLLGGEPVTTDEFVDFCGGVGLCYETGFVGDLTRVDVVYENILNVLRDQGMIALGTSPGTSPLREPEGSSEPRTANPSFAGGALREASPSPSPSSSPAKGRLGGVSPRFVYELVDRINLTEAGFRFAEGFGTGSFQEFKQGDTISYIGDEPLVAQYDGVILFPKVPEHWKIDHPVMFLGRMV